MILRKTQEGAFVGVDYGPLVSKTLLRLDGHGDKRVKILTCDIREIVCCYSIEEAYSSYGIDLTQHSQLTVSCL
jgi:hypothetical protein